MESKTIRFIRRGELVSLNNVPPDRTLLEVLREDLACTGTKEGCGEGDCGACTVVLGETRGGRLAYRAINSCIRLAHSVDGLAVWTVEDIAGEDGALHPSQEAMVQCHGSQCGFCTPGFVMSLFGMYQNHVCQGGTITRALAQEELSGNLCRCTGYRPIFDAAQQMENLPRVAVREQALLAQLEALNSIPTTFQAAPAIPPTARAELVEAGAHPSTSSGRTGGGRTGGGRMDGARMDGGGTDGGRTGEGRTDQGRTDSGASPTEGGAGQAGDGRYWLPRTLPELLALRTAHPQAQIVAGTTDVGLWVTKMHMRLPQVLDVTRVEELRRVEHYEHHLAIGAAASLTEAFAALVADRPQLKAFASRFAGLPVRNSGTLGGNVANGSPIGDSMPLLIALGAHVVLLSARGHRDVPLEQFYTGYRKNILGPDEVVAWIKVPRPSAGEFVRAYKISKRFDDDISAICLVINMTAANGTVDHVLIGAGGVAATPARAVQTESLLVGAEWSAATAQRAADALRAEFQPISDMRASSAYRAEVLGNLVQRFWLESQGLQYINLESFRPAEATAA